MNVKLTDSDKPFEFGEMVVGTIGYLNICAHCGECLKQIVADPNKLNVVLFYRDDEGTIKEWKPKDNKSDDFKFDKKGNSIP